MYFLNFFPVSFSLSLSLSSGPSQNNALVLSVDHDLCRVGSNAYQFLLFLARTKKAGQESLWPIKMVTETLAAKRPNMRHVDLLDNCGSWLRHSG